MHPHTSNCVILLLLVLLLLLLLLLLLQFCQWPRLSG
jgi:hypothetical protein